MNRLKNIAGEASLALILTFTVGAGCVLGGVVLWELVKNLLRANQPPPPDFHERLVLTEDGTPLIRRFQYLPVRKVETLDLARNPIERPANEELLQPAVLNARPPREAPWLLPRRYWNWSRYRVRQVAVTGLAGEIWYVVFNGNRSKRYYLQGMNIESGETIGYIGREGFQETKPDEEKLFEIGTLQLESMLDRTMSTGESSLVFALDDHRLLTIDLANRTVKPLIDDTILSMDALDKRTWSFSTSDPGKIVAIRTPGRVRILEWNGELQRAFPIPEDLQDQPFEFFALEKGAIYLTHKWRSPSDDFVVRDDYRLVRVTEAGTITEQTTVSLSQAYRSVRIDGDELAFGIVTAMVPATVWSVGFAFGFLPEIASVAEDDLNFSDALKLWGGKLWWVVALVMGFCGWLAWLTFRHQQQHGEPNGWFWAVFVFVFGLPGYVGYRLHRHWPYNKPLAAPDPTGREVFAH